MITLTFSDVSDSALSDVLATGEIVSLSRNHDRSHSYTVIVETTSSRVVGWIRAMDRPHRPEVCRAAVDMIATLGNTSRVE